MANSCKKSIPIALTTIERDRITSDTVDDKFVPLFVVGRGSRQLGRINRVQRCRRMVLTLRRLFQRSLICDNSAYDHVRPSRFVRRSAAVSYRIL